MLCGTLETWPIYIMFLDVQVQRGIFNVTRKRETRKRGRCMNMKKLYQSNSEIGGV